jgi:deoxyribodipyrimidine photo-lyase
LINPKRIRLLQKGEDKKGPVVYWMSRDQRTHDNWALLFSQQIANEREPVVVVFNLVPEFLDAAIRQYGFMLKGLEETEKELKKYNIPFYLLMGEPQNTLPEFLKEVNASVLVADFDPLKIKRIWKRDVAKKIDIPFYEVDAHNIVPAFYVSDKEEFAAYTIRPKIHKALPEFLEEYPNLEKQKSSEALSSDKIDWGEIPAKIKVDFSVKEVGWIKPGPKSSLKILDDFLEKKFDSYSENRNDPTKDGQSNLSPYLHFGQISSQRIALNVQKHKGNKKSEEAFLEELIVRKELSDNFCYFNKNYDSFNGFRNWAKESLIKHKDDKREFIYTKEQFDKAETHEDLWNAAQRELITTGKLHGYMRMYWAKKILEWTNTPEYAMKIAVYLNDKYELDGRDPNGYTGCAWSIGGVHDRPWFEREIFGKVRYMNKNGTEKKFDVKAYVKGYTF